MRGHHFSWTSICRITIDHFESSEIILQLLPRRSFYPPQGGMFLGCTFSLRPLQDVDISNENQKCNLPSNVRQQQDLLGRAPPPWQARLSYVILKTDNLPASMDCSAINTDSNHRLICSSSHRSIPLSNNQKPLNQRNQTKAH